MNLMTSTDAVPSSTVGRLIVVEGGDGAGKTTQIELLAQRFDALVTFEPGDTPLGARLRELLLHGMDLDPRAEALLMAADRAQHVAEVLRPTLASGRDVICARFTWSSIAYQGAGRNLGEDNVAELDAFARAGLTPNATVLLDIDPRVAADRVSARAEPDRIEAAGDTFHATVRAAMLHLAAAEPSVVVDASASIDAVHTAVMDGLAALGITPRHTGGGTCRFCGGYGWTADPLPSGEPDLDTVAECVCAEPTVTAATAAEDVAVNES